MEHDPCHAVWFSLVFFLFATRMVFSRVFLMFIDARMLLSLSLSLLCVHVLIGPLLLLHSTCHTPGLLPVLRYLLWAGWGLGGWVGMFASKCAPIALHTCGLLPLRYVIYFFSYLLHPPHHILCCTFALLFVSSLAVPEFQNPSSLHLHSLRVVFSFVPRCLTLLLAGPMDWRLHRNNAET